MNTINFDAVLSQTAETLAKLGFTTDEKTSEDEKITVSFSGEKGNVRFVFEAGKLSVFDDSGRRIVYALLDDDASDKDIKFVSGEIIETFEEKFGEKSPTEKKSGVKKPQTVSKAAVKAGMNYDESTLASKICLVFPSLREEYKANIEFYGEFLAQEFFTEHATPLIIEAIKENKPATMKKLFQILNEMFEDGTNDLQSLIAVTILGELKNDQILLARCVDYMSETMAPPVIEVNKYLASRKGKKAQEKLKNPPAYKPKKEKKGGILDKIMGGGRQGLNNQ